MGLVVLLLDGGSVPAVGPGVAGGLAALGVTSVAVLHDEGSTAVVVEGWAFDHRRSGRDAARAIAPGRRDVRVLLPVLHTSLEPSARSERGDEELRPKRP